MIDISVKDLVKSFDADTNLLDGVSFDIQAGERVGHAHRVRCAFHALSDRRRL